MGTEEKLPCAVNETHRPVVVNDAEHASFNGITEPCEDDAGLQGPHRLPPFVRRSQRGLSVLPAETEWVSVQSPTFAQALARLPRSPSGLPRSLAKEEHTQLAPAGDIP